jgi:hypothetical protein
LNFAGNSGDTLLFEAPHVPGDAHGKAHAVRGAPDRNGDGPNILGKFGDG